ncbi:GNAT family N-acetyltransferase [Clostridium oryzae]|uniref:Putative acetyltransferase n=1 Tax=Clostridium oryzae TaxID=1450648 RepID=A0A1V4IYJ6_9CLOT|nr:GNAT family N-acetyltransferase [Clostridium oryzae]OPJ65142.1 putative acetyltransferase [Clostridium oryzae]
MNNIEFSVAEDKDLEEIFQVFSAAIEEMNRNNIPQWDEIYPSRDILQEDIEKKQLYIGKVNTEIACVFALNCYCDEEYADGKWEYPQATYKVIHRLCVNPKFQKQGIGTATLTYIEEQVKGEGVESIRLDAFSLNPFAQKMYNKQRYKIVGEVNWRKGKFYLMEKKL